jgi:hypothetical protein
MVKKRTSPALVGSNPYSVGFPAGVGVLTAVGGDMFYESKTANATAGAQFNSEVTGNARM